MCGRFTLSSPRQAIEQRFGVRFGVDLAGIETAPRYNVAPSQDILAVSRDREGIRRIESMRWGLVPHWSKDGKAKGSTLNARVETLETSAMFRDAFRKRRCLIPADGFYEWQKIEGAPSNARKGRGAAPKIPYWIAPEDGEILGFAGVYAVWRARDSDPWRLSCAIVTAPASEALVTIHDRMPVALPPERWDAWLARDTQDVEPLRALLTPDPRLRYRTVAVSSLVNDPAQDGPELIRPRV